MRQGQPPASKVAPWYKISNKAKNEKVTKVYIYDAIGGWFGVEVQDFVKELNDIDTDEIHVHINSPGGSVYDGISIYNALRQHDSTVHTYVDGLAASAASFIAQAGEKVIMGRNATMMIHDAIGACYGNRADMLQTADLLDKVSDNIADIYAKNAGGDTAEWRELMKAETWYSAQEALDAGLCTEMLDADDEDEDADTENKWDLSQLFNYAGREFAPSPARMREQVNNRLKEASMSGTTVPKNTEGAPEGTPPGTEPETPAAEPAPEPDAPEGGEEETGDSGAQAPESAPENKAGVTFLINGAKTTNLQAVQNHINTLETFRSETIDQSRRDYVEGLSKGNKILASQVDGLTELVLSFSNEQFDKWKASYDAAPATTLFDPHGQTPGDQSRPGNGGGADAVAAEIADLEQVVADHKRVGMSQEQIEKKESWKRLQALKSKQTTN